MEAAGISIISPTTLADLAPSPSRRKSGNCRVTSITLSTGNKIHAAEEPCKNKPGWFRQLLRDDASWRETLLTGLAELVGTAILLFVGCMGCVGSLGTPPSALQIALTFGFTVTCIIQLIGHISVAHINPSVTICSVILGLKSLSAAAVYLVAQLLGAVIGYGLLKIVTPNDLLHDGNVTSATSFCMTSLNVSISPIQGLVTETVATAILIFLCCASWDPRNERNSDSTAIKFGLTVATLSMSVGPYTGCSMNPARSFAPALWNNRWTLHWLYWLGPIAGSVVVSLAYKTLFWPKKSSKEDIPERVLLTQSEQKKLSATETLVPVHFRGSSHPVDDEGRDPSSFVKVQ